MRSSTDYLFRGISIFQVVEARGQQVDQAVATYDGNKLLNTSTDDLARYFEQEYELEVPSVDISGADVAEEEATVEVYDQFASFRGGYGDTISVPGTRVTFTLPFSGDANFFRFQPSRMTSMPPRAEVRGNVLIFQMAGRTLQQTEVKNAIDGFVADVQQHLGWFASDVDAFNQQVGKRASRVIEARKSKLLAAQSLVAGLGYPLRERVDALKTYAAPQVRRKIEPKPPAASTAPYKPEPVLAEAEYQHILKVCQDMSTVLERSPSAFKGMGEEALRQHFLVQLNGHYEGNATGETFNMEGKTDILIRVDGKNIFIGECKFWKGEKAYLETIDQILGYLSWRDTKAAIIVFNRNKDFSSVLHTIKSATSNHPNAKSGPKQEGETRFRYVFRNKIDASRELVLTAMAFDVPT